MQDSNNNFIGVNLEIDSPYPLDVPLTDHQWERQALHPRYHQKPQVLSEFQQWDTDIYKESDEYRFPSFPYILESEDGIDQVIEAEVFSVNVPDYEHVDMSNGEIITIYKLVTRVIPKEGGRRISCKDGVKIEFKETLENIHHGIISPESLQEIFEKDSLKEQEQRLRNQRKKNNQNKRKQLSLPL
jgi:hypothetical protein